MRPSEHPARPDALSRELRTATALAAALRPLPAPWLRQRAVRRRRARRLRAAVATLVCAVWVTLLFGVREFGVRANPSGSGRNGRRRYAETRGGDGQP